MAALQGRQGLRGTGELDSSPRYQSLYGKQIRDEIELCLAKRSSLRRGLGRRNRRDKVIQGIEFCAPEGCTFAAQRDVPDYPESCTSIFTEEERLAGNFCSSIPGKVPASAADSTAPPCAEAVDTKSPRRNRL